MISVDWLEINNRIIRVEGRMRREDDLMWPFCGDRKPNKTSIQHLNCCLQQYWWGKVNHEFGRFCCLFSGFDPVRWILSVNKHCCCCCSFVMHSSHAHTDISPVTPLSCIHSAELFFSFFLWITKTTVTCLWTIFKDWRFFSKINFKTISR